MPLVCSQLRLTKHYTLPSSSVNGAAAGGAVLPEGAVAAICEAPRRWPPCAEAPPGGGVGRRPPWGVSDGRVSIGASAICLAVFMERAIRRYTLAWQHKRTEFEPRQTPAACATPLQAPRGSGLCTAADRAAAVLEPAIQSFLPTQLPPLAMAVDRAQAVMSRSWPADDRAEGDVSEYVAQDTCLFTTNTQMIDLQPGAAARQDAARVAHEARKERDIAKVRARRLRRRRPRLLDAPQRRRKLAGLCRHKGVQVLRGPRQHLR